MSHDLTDCSDDDASSMAGSRVLLDGAYSAVRVVISGLVAATWTAVRQSVDVAAIARRPGVAFLVRTLWLGIAAVAASALLGDISELRRVN